MTNNVVPLFPTAPNLPADWLRSGVERLEAEGWILKGEQWFPPEPIDRDRVDGSFVLAMHAETIRLVGDAAQSNWRAGFRRGVSYMAPWLVAAFIAGAALARWVL